MNSYVFLTPPTKLTVLTYDPVHRIMYAPLWVVCTMLLAWLASLCLTFMIGYFAGYTTGDREGFDKGVRTAHKTMSHPNSSFTKDFIKNRIP